MSTFTPVEQIRNSPIMYDFWMPYLKNNVVEKIKLGNNMNTDLK